MAWNHAVPAAEFHSVPEPLIGVFDFMNTLDERSFGDLEPSDDLPEWLTEHDIEDERAARRLRRALRAAAVTNRTGEPAPETVEFPECPLRAQLGPAGVGLTGDPLAELLAAVVLAAADGTWLRMKACGAPDCGWIFYDHSKPHNARWCSTAGCGNRMKTRAYRRRANSTPSR
ncbi:CGNR zinc finger domain-containing protein [Amycolatopsis nigrescens]|uniref:CGNR zinc finger domain-containing protein n=1 Tax=Amycolatopsis nigrescens TaxID=381445 RepID=UPI00036A23E2|nr:CGNR zinc finger domain-containing protein [Amycolatopsis nigrescens]